MLLYHVDAREAITDLLSRPLADVVLLNVYGSFCHCRSDCQFLADFLNGIQKSSNTVVISAYSIDAVAGSVRPVVFDNCGTLRPWKSQLGDGEEIVSFERHRQRVQGALSLFSAVAAPSFVALIVNTEESDDTPLGIATRAIINCLQSTICHVTIS